MGKNFAVHLKKNEWKLWNEKYKNELVSKCIPKIGKKWDLVGCLQFVSDLIMALLSRLAQIMALINKAINWVMDKIPFIKQAFAFAEDLLTNILFKPINDCKAASGFQSFEVW